MSIRGTPRSGIARRCVAGAELVRGRTFFRLRVGFALAESVIAMTVIGLAGAAVLTSVAGAVTSCNDAIFQAVGRGLAEQLMDEITAANFPPVVSVVVPFSGSRSAFTKIDDYSNFSESPPHTKSGEILGTEQSSSSGTGSLGLSSGTSASRPTVLQAAPDFVKRFARAVLVERVQPTSTGGWAVVTQYTSYRRVTVTVTYSLHGSQPRRVAEVTRLFVAVAPAP